MPTDLVPILEAAYQLDDHEVVWLRRVREAIVPSAGAPMGAVAATYRWAAGKLIVRSLDFTGSRASRPMVDLIASERPAAFVRPWLGTVAAFGSDLPAHNDAVRVGADLGFDFREAFGIHAADPTGVGVVITFPLPAGKRPSRFADRGMWDRVAAHVASGFRVQRLVASANLEDEAILDPGGRILEARGPAAEKSARTLLRAACQTVDRVRACRDPGEESIDPWTSLFGARWSLVDRFERDGRRYVVAVRNMLADGSPPLTAREAQVVGLLAQGHSNKLIAYELGLAASTVRVLVHRSAQKLRVKTRADLEIRARDFRLEMPRGLDGEPVPEGT